MSEEEIELKLEQARRAGVWEILLISGERPDRLPHIREELSRRGYPTFIDFACAVARRVLDAGYLPHGNYGALSRDELLRCKESHASMGVMLENVVDDPLMAPQKRAAGRLATLRAAGEARVPFTSGILIGLGESPASRLESLRVLAEIHHQWGHLQEIILQNFIPNHGSALRLTPDEPILAEYLDLIAYWRTICPGVAVQVPPNLNPYWEVLLPKLDDLGGISPERDEVNPDSPWETRESYRRKARAHGLELRPRLAVYSRYLEGDWVSNVVRQRAQSIIENVYSDSVAATQSCGTSSLCITENKDRFESFLAMPLDELVAEADALRRARYGMHTTYVVNRNINFTNVCHVGCHFCGFARKQGAQDAYVRDIEEIVETLCATPDITEVCLQGGIHPQIEMDYYRRLVRRIRDMLPELHIHAFSPMEIDSLCSKTGWKPRDVLWALKDDGLNTIPGTAAEILVDRVRNEISGLKLTSARWEEIIRAAHALGLRSTATVMYGHIETWDDIHEHFEILRRIQMDTGGFTELVPLAFIPYRNRLGKKLWPQGFEQQEILSMQRSDRLYPLARMWFDDCIPHLQTSWVKLGVEGAVRQLSRGCDDFGGTLFEESITRESGGQHGELMRPDEIQRSLNDAGWIPVERSTLYGVLESGACIGNSNSMPSLSR